jgi:hypothetical protein
VRRSIAAALRRADIVGAVKIVVAISRRLTVGNMRATSTLIGHGAAVGIGGVVATRSEVAYVGCTVVAIVTTDVPGGCCELDDVGELRATVGRRTVALVLDQDVRLVTQGRRIARLNDVRVLAEDDSADLGIAWQTAERRSNRTDKARELAVRAICWVARPAWTVRAVRVAFDEPDRKVALWFASGRAGPVARVSTGRIARWIGREITRIASDKTRPAPGNATIELPGPARAGLNHVPRFNDLQCVIKSVGVYDLNVAVRCITWANRIDTAFSNADAMHRAYRPSATVPLFIPQNVKLHRPIDGDGLPPRVSRPCENDGDDSAKRVQQPSLQKNGVVT